jgi:hypothetical protein
MLEQQRMPCWHVRFALPFCSKQLWCGCMVPRKAHLRLIAFAVTQQQKHDYLRNVELVHLDPD